MKVLLLDDDPDMCELLKEALESFGIQEIHTCRNYQDIVDINGKIADFDIAILDVNLGLGQKNGVDAYNWMIKNGFSHRTIFFTGHGRSYPLLLSALQNPNVALLAKPASIAMIKKAIYDQ